MTGHFFKIFWSGGMRRFVASVLLIAVLATSFNVLTASKANAAYCCGAWEADAQAMETAVGDVIPPIIKGAHNLGVNLLNFSITALIGLHRTWVMEIFIKDHVVKALMKMAEQMSATGMQQVFAIGTMMDAKQQLETQRVHQELAFEAHRDYQPSEDFCEFGTSVRSMAASERLSKVNALALSNRQMNRHLGKVFSSGSTGASEDFNNRWRQFVKVYCDPTDRGWFDNAPEGSTGLSEACEAAEGDPKRYNIDVDYTRLIENARTLGVSFLDQEDGAPSPDEEDIIALGNNLFGHKPLTRSMNENALKNELFKEYLLALRGVAAKRSVAEHSYNTIVGMKSEGTGNNYEFLASILSGLGVADPDLPKYLGENPSYYAQLEVLAKRIYQNPTFFSNLYDTPANVSRKSVALRAIELMLDRAIFESQLRQEMSMSVLLSTKLRDRFVDVREKL